MFVRRCPCGVGNHVFLQGTEMVLIGVRMDRMVPSDGLVFSSILLT
jgi:hypothetical protein